MSEVCSSDSKSSVLHTECYGKHQRDYLVIESNRLENLMYFCITIETIACHCTGLMKKFEEINRIIP